MPSLSKPVAKALNNLDRLKSKTKAVWQPSEKVKGSNPWPVKDHYTSCCTSQQNKLRLLQPSPFTEDGESSSFHHPLGGGGLRT